MVDNALYAHQGSSLHRQTQDDVRQADSLFAQVYLRQDHVDDVASELEIVLPDCELLSSTFRKRLLAEEDAGDGSAQPGATDWVLVPMRSGGVFRRSLSGARQFITYNRPTPTGDISENPLLATTRLAKGFAAGDTIINGLTVPSWMKGEGFPARMDEHVGASMAKRSATLVRLLQDLHLRIDAPLVAEYWTEQRADSVAGQLAASRTADSSASGGLRSSIVYLAVGIKDGRVKMLYVGKTGRGYSRIAQHIRATVAWQIAGADAAPLHYQVAATCSQIIYFPVIEALSPDASAAATTLAIWEWLLCWMLGAFQLNADLLIMRLKYNLPPLPSVMGVNATACLDGPGRQLSPALPHDEQVAIRDPVLLDLSSALATSQAQLLGQRVLAARGGNADVRSARERVGQTRCFLSDRRKTLALAGKLEYLWPLHEDARMRRLGYELKTGDKAKLRIMAAGTADSGLFCVRVRLGASSPESDLFLGCIEEDRPLYKGMVLEIGRAGTGQFPLKVQIMHVPFSPIAQALADQIFGMLPDEEQVRRQSAAQAKKAEIAARSSRNHQQLSSTAQKLQAGTCPLNQFVCLVLDAENRLFNCLADSRDVAAVAEMSSALGFGIRAWTDHDYPQTFAMLVTGGTGLYDFAQGTAASIPHVPQEEGFELRLLGFNNSWVTCPRRLTPMAYKTPEAQRRNGASFTAFLNAGREIVGLPARETAYLPPGFEASGGFDYKVSGRTKQGVWRYNRCGGLNLVGGGTYFDFCEADVRGVFGVRPEDGPLEATLMWRTNILICSREEDLVFEFRVDGVEEAPWYQHVWTAPHNRGYRKRARCWRFMSELKARFEAAGEESGQGGD